MKKHSGEQHLIELLNAEIEPFSFNNENDLKKISDKIGNARIVLMGEATHGTYEFYQSRVELSKYLIANKGFHAIAIEGDWTSVYPMHRYINGYGSDDIHQVLKEFVRFPTWMWRNETIPSFLNWLKEYNSHSNIKVGFYGLDLYCLNEAMQAVIEYLNVHDQTAAAQAKKRYACFNHAAVDPQMYGYLVDANIKKNCIKEVTEQLIEFQHDIFNRMKNDNIEEKEILFYTLQNARLIKNAEHYYRAMFESHENTWNIRDQHMVETLQNLISQVETKLNTPAKIIIWAHNSHVGDARATEMSNRKEVNLGQLVREHFSNISFHLGFSTYTGTVTAADDWGEPESTKKIVPALDESYEGLFHKLKLRDFILSLHAGQPIEHLLKLSRLQRAIGVIYRPDTERLSHYFFSNLPYQFDAIIHFDQTRAVKKLQF